MTFIIIALSLFAERFLLEQETYRQPDWFRRYTLWLQQQSWGEWMTQSIAGIIVILAPILIVIGLLQAMFDDILGGVPELLFATLVLLFCLGPRDLHRQVNRFIEARETEDNDKAERIGNELISGTPPQEQSAYARAIANSILEQAYTRTFSVIFWFVILGPLGAILYRSGHTLKQFMPAQNDLGREFKGGVNRLLEILDWIPVRLTAFTYALSGNFHAATHEWWGSSNKSAKQIIDQAGSGALGLDSSKQDETLEPEVTGEIALALILRSITIWAGLLALITIASWVS